MKKLDWEILGLKIFLNKKRELLFFDILEPKIWVLLNFCPKIRNFFQLEFIKNYMDESLAGSPKALSMTNENRLQLAEALQKEVEAFFIVPNLLWAMWAMAQSVSTKITFGYWVRNNIVEEP